MPHLPSVCLGWALCVYDTAVSQYWWSRAWESGASRAQLRRVHREASCWSFGPAVNLENGTQRVPGREPPTYLSSGVEAILLHVLVYISILPTRRTVLDHMMSIFFGFFTANITLASDLFRYLN